jgi:hypothetical protein
MTKKSIASALICLGISHMLFQPNQIIAQDDCCDLVVVPGYSIEEGCVNAGYIFPAEYNLDCAWDFYARGEFIYFAYSQEVVPPLAQRFTFVDDIYFQDQRTTNNLLMRSPYRPGFRVSVGVDLDAVVLDATYMRYHSSVSQNFLAGNNAGLGLTTGAQGILAGDPNNGAPPQPGNSTLFATIKAKREILLDRLLLTAQRPVYMGKRIIMDLNFGLLTYWNAQNWRFDATALAAPPFGVITSNGFSTARHKGWAVGPDLGFRAIALLPCNFQGLFRVDLSLLYAQLSHGRTVTSFPQAPLPTNNTTLVRKKAGFSQAVQSAEIGIGWGDYFACNKYHIDLYVTYNFLSQYLIDEGIPYSSTAHDAYFFSYSLQGFAIGGRLDF